MIADKKVLEAMKRLSDAVSDVEDKFVEYHYSVQRAKDAAKNLEEATRKFLSKPHISIDDFEIDN